VITDSKVILSLGKHQKSPWKIPSDYGQQSNTVLTIFDVLIGLMLVRFFIFFFTKIGGWDEIFKKLIG